MLGRPYHSDPGPQPRHPRGVPGARLPDPVDPLDPQGPKYLERFFKDDLKAGRIKTPLEINDVWPENYSANSAQKVWAAKFAARHPNVVVLDLSSFKCGHDAPTYGLIDSIISSSATPYSALHDIDANKPGGSIKIRVKTYAHSLKLHEERLEDAAHAPRRADAPDRREAAGAARARSSDQLEARKQQDPALEAQIDETKAKVAEYSKRRRGQQAQGESDRGGARSGAGAAGNQEDGVDDREIVGARLIGGATVETVETNETSQSAKGRIKLPILGERTSADIDVDAELKKFEPREAALGLEPGKEHWRDDNPTTFTGSSARTPRCSSRA